MRQWWPIPIVLVGLLLVSSFAVLNARTGLASEGTATPTEEPTSTPEEEEDTPTPTPTTEPTATATDTPTPTPTDTPTPTPTPTAEPTETPTPEPGTPTATPDGTPDVTPEPGTPTPTPQATPVVTPEPGTPMPEPGTPTPAPDTPRVSDGNGDGDNGDGRTFVSPLPMPGQRFDVAFDCRPVPRGVADYLLAQLADERWDALGADDFWEVNGFVSFTLGAPGEPIYTAYFPDYSSTDGAQEVYSGAAWEAGQDPLVLNLPPYGGPEGLDGVGLYHDPGAESRLCVAIIQRLLP